MSDPILHIDNKVEREFSLLGCFGKRPPPFLGRGYTISEVARFSGASHRALRYYEEIGILTPHRTSARQRQFCSEQRELARRITRMRRLGLSINDIRILNDESIQEDIRQTKLIDLLKSRLERMETQAMEIRVVLSTMMIGGS